MPEIVVPMVTITDSYLMGMARNRNVLALLPFLGGLNKLRRPGCGSCRSSNRIVSGTYATAKKLIAGLPSDKKAALKRALGAKNVRVTYRNDGNRIVTLTF